MKCEKIDGWSRLVWHNFVKVRDNWIKICNLVYKGTYNMSCAFWGHKPSRFIESLNGGKRRTSARHADRVIAWHDTWWHISCHNRFSDIYVSPAYGRDSGMCSAGDRASLDSLYCVVLVLRRRRAARRWPIQHCRRRLLSTRSKLTLTMSYSLTFLTRLAASNPFTQHVSH